jgi:hypothetical protein
MKKSVLLCCLTALFMLCSMNFLSAQSDKEITKSAQAALDKKDYESAFNQIITLKSNKSKKAQEVIKKAYPGLIAKNNKKATGVKLIDKDANQTKCEKYQEIIDAYTANANADESLKSFVTPELYKTLSKKKIIDKNVSNNTDALKRIKDDMAKKEEQIRKDSIAKVEAYNLALEAEQKRIADSIAAAKKVVEVSTPVTTSGPRFYIIAGSFKSEEGAQAAVNKLKAQGYPSQMVNRNSYGNMRISYNSFAKKEDAQKELERIKSKLQPDAWILEK